MYNVFKITDASYAFDQDGFAGYFGMGSAKAFDDDPRNWSIAY